MEEVAADEEGEVEGEEGEEEEEVEGKEGGEEVEEEGEEPACSRPFHTALFEEGKACPYWL